MQNIYNKIVEYDTIIIHGHKRPDGDCIGSQYGLMYLIKESFPNKNVIVTGDTSEYVSFLGCPSILEDEELFNNALSICVDCATVDRLSDNRFTKAAYSIKIDHHIPVDNYGDYQYVDTTAPACCQIITEFYLKFKDKLVMSSDCAKALYTGIVTDTGRFRFDSVSSRTFSAAATLVDNGVKIEEIDGKLSVETLNTLKLKGYVLSNFKMTENGFAYIKMTRDVVEKYQVSDEDAASQVSSISGIEGCPVWALFMEYPGNEIRIRLRSRGPVINLLAEEYHGGGHAKASGASLDKWEDLEEFANKADALVKNYKENL